MSVTLAKDILLYQTVNYVLSKPGYRKIRRNPVIN